MMPKSDTLSEGGKVIQKDGDEIIETTSSLSLRDESIIDENGVVMEEALNIEKPKVVPNLTEEEYEKMRSALER